MLNNNSNKNRQPISCLFFIFLLACNQQKKTKAITFNTNNNLLQNKIALAKVVKNIITADVVTRTGNDFTSQSLKTLNRVDKTFSHCGIASVENDSVFVYHAIGGNYNPNQQIQRTYIEEFAAPSTNKAFGVYRFKLNATQHKALINQAKYYYQKKVIFDMDFDLATNNKMYCTEFVFKSFLYGVKQFTIFNISQIDTKKFVGVDDIILHPLATPIIIYHYK